MKNIATITLVITSLIVGYNIHPFLNPEKLNKADSLIPKATQIEKNSQECQESLVTLKSNSTNELKTPTPKEVSSENKFELSKESDIKHTESMEVDENQSVEYVDNSFVEPDSIALSELKEWTTEHKEQLIKEVEKNIPEKFHEKIKKGILEDNDFLESPTVKQDPMVDSDWAYNMEYYLRALIEQHELSENFDIYSITCKQLVCDILGVETVAYSWMKILNSFFQDPTLMSQIEPSMMNGNTFPQDGVTYAYMKIGFKKEN